MNNNTDTNINIKNTNTNTNNNNSNNNNNNINTNNTNNNICLDIEYHSAGFWAFFLASASCRRHSPTVATPRRLWCAQPRYGHTSGCCFYFRYLRNRADHTPRAITRQ